jgi:hypothetical protein
MNQFMEIKDTIQAIKPNYVEQTHQQHYSTQLNSNMMWVGLTSWYFQAAREREREKERSIIKSTMTL